MATSYTSLLGFALPVTGELSGTWGDVVNDSITELVEDAIAGSATADVTSGDWTLTTTGSGAANQARNAILIPTGTPGVSRNIIAPGASKAYIVDNQSDGAVVVKGAATTGATVAAGTAALVAWDGSDFVLVSQDLANATGTLAVNKGGTGQTSYTNGQLLIGNTTGNTLAKATLTAGSGVSITNGAGSISIAATGSGGTVTSVSGTGTVNGISLSGTVTSSGSLTLGGALTGVNLTTQVTGTLPVANGGTGITSFGTGVATALGQNVTGSGGAVLATSPAIATPTITGTKETRVAIAASDIDLSAGNYFTRTISGTTTLTVSNTAASGSVSAFILDLTNGGSATVNWFSGVTWAAGTPPTLTASGRDVLGFFTHDAGTTWSGFVLGLGMA